MIKFLGELPRKCVVAFSGGVDSVAVADFLLNGGRDVTLAFFHHGTPTSTAAEEFVTGFARRRGVPLSVGRITGERPRGDSPEEHWRKERYRFLGIFESPVVTAHHLDDAVETWIFNSLHGKPRLIPPVNGNVIRPFLITPKSEMVGWCTRRGLTWVEDESNVDVRYARNRIRHRIVPEALHVNPGLNTVVRKMYIEGEVRGWKTRDAEH